MEQRKTPQRQAILNQLRGRTDHPTAQTLYMELKHAWPRLSLGTVYRNLTQLCKNGQVLRIACEGGADHFDFNTAQHYHLLCQRCGGVCDVPNPITGLRSVKGFKGEIHSIEVHFTGICPACKNRERAAKMTETPPGSEYILHLEGEEP